MHHIGGQCYCALFSEGCILGDAALPLNLCAHQNGERGTVAACDACTRGQYSALSPESCGKKTQAYYSGGIRSHDLPLQTGTVVSELSSQIQSPLQWSISDDPRWPEEDPPEIWRWEEACEFLRYSVSSSERLITHAPLVRTGTENKKSKCSVNTFSLTNFPVSWPVVSSPFSSSSVKKFKCKGLNITMVRVTAVKKVWHSDPDLRRYIEMDGNDIFGNPWSYKFPWWRGDTLQVPTPVNVENGRPWIISYQPPTSITNSYWSWLELPTLPFSVPTTGGKDLSSMDTRRQLTLSPVPGICIALTNSISPNSSTTKSYCLACKERKITAM